MIIHKPKISASEDKSTVSIRFPLGIDRQFLDDVKKEYEINGDYSVIGLDSSVMDRGGYLVIFSKKYRL